MFDYKLLHALSIVIKQQSFEKAANEMCITQSAVSQRIRLLEQNLGQPVLIRNQPIALTAIGARLLTHYQQVQLLEQDIQPDIDANNKSELVNINIASNADSLAIWLTDALNEVAHEHKVAANILISDEERTIQYLKRGEVFGAISTQQKPLPGCMVDLLGNMEYALVANPAFIERYFGKGINKESLMQAPAVAFDQKDNMHIKFIEEEFGLKGGSYPCHTVRSSEAFVDFATKGLAYCLIPKLQIEEQLNTGLLVNLLPKSGVTRTLYWHRWALLKGVFKILSNSILYKAKRVLPYE